MPAAGAAVPEVAEGAGQLGELDEPPEPRVRGPSGRAGLMKPLVVLALPGMYLFYKYSQYRREQRELSRRRVTERELQHLHHKIDQGPSSNLLGIGGGRGSLKSTFLLCRLAEENAFVFVHELESRDTRGCGVIHVDDEPG
ncbi:hypothetical protein KPH14_003345 [Odynerus spinipes]|uniref:Uncharacterized protein n=1 Tax=Odynerus spinipes TaxID=1348599 RepID=A0AAD9RCN4_9HYME|nr:hypothetical protein KPH14_003345 [Odynerus spinipes]